MNRLYRFVALVNPIGVAGGMLLLVWLLGACQPQPAQVYIEVDGRRQALTTEAETVRDALAEANIVLEPLDKVKPDLYARLEPGLNIEVIRVTEEIEVEREIIPFERQIVTNEALDPGQTRLAQLGVNGEDEITMQLVSENGREVSRTEVSRRTVIEPQPEILVVGPRGALTSTPISGTIAYLSNGNAWLMRGESGSRRTLTTEGDLDGRVFALAPDGRRLVYTRRLTGEIESPLNELWLASTTIVNEPPLSLGLRGLLRAAWSPVVTASALVYSTADRTANPPGWQANNDLWLIRLDSALTASPPEPVNLLEANTQGLYPWWGMTFTWSPDGRRLAYARADQVGIIEVPLTGALSISQSFKPLADFSPFQTFSEWVWTPSLSWSPDGKFIAAVIHGPAFASEAPEESQVFDLWLFSVDGTVAAKVADQVGMWANPAWGEAGLAFGRAINPLQSANSRYTLHLMDRDGSNHRRLFPVLNDTGVQFPEMVWSPAGDRLLFVYNGNLYSTAASGGPPRQLTRDSQAGQPQWVMPATSPPSLTESQTVTPTGSITPPPRLRRSVRTSPTLSLTQTPTATGVTTETIPFDSEEEVKGNR